MNFLKQPFSGNKEEKAYLMGLRFGDFSAQIHGKCIRVYVGSTHPAMLNLFRNIFSIYGKIGIYPKHSKSSNSRMPKYSWRIYCDVDKTFDFILKKHDKIPEWITQDNKLFLSFLSGYFDAEGCISISYKYGNGGNVSWIIKSTDKQILENINQILLNQDLNIVMRLCKSADGVEYRKDYWSIVINRRKQVLKLLNSMNLKHEEKIMKYKLAIELIDTNWKDANKKIVELRSKIKNDVNICIESAKNEYLRRHDNTSDNSKRVV